MTAEAGPDWLEARQNTGIRLGLDRVRGALAMLGHPERAAQFALVGGTNGKGSVAAMLESVLRAAGHRTGLYTSPHLVRIGERIRLQGEPISQSEFLSSAAAVREPVERFDLTYFEALTVLAFHRFREAGIRIGVLEVGLGGRLDATNVVDPLVSVVTNIALDHAAELGGTIERIAVEKAGVFRAGTPAVTAATGPGLRVLKDEALSRRTPLLSLHDQREMVEVTLSATGTRVAVHSERWGRVELQTVLAGRHQAMNLWTAIEASALLPARFRPSIGALRQGIEETRWPGRLERRRHGGAHLLLDVAHNPAGIDALCESLDMLDIPSPRTAVVSICADKPWELMLDRLARSVDALVLTIPPSMPAGRRWGLGRASELVPEGVPVKVIPDVGAALDRAVTMGPHGTVIVAGSIFLVGDVMRRLDTETDMSGLPR